MKNKLLKAALEYVEAGLSVVPVAPGCARPPLVKWKRYIKQRPTRAQVREWWERWPNANIAIITGEISGVTVLDCDTRSGGKTDYCPPTGTVVQTPGGYHFFYDYTPFLKTTADGDKTPTVVNGEHLKGIDIRNDGGYVIAVPSIRNDNKYTDKGYSWKLEGELSELPSRWHIHKSESEEDGSSEEGSVTIEFESTKHEPWVSSMLQNGIKGGRNNGITKLAGYFFSRDIPYDIVESICNQVLDKSPSDHPFSKEELTTTLKSVYKAEQRKKKSNKQVRVSSQRKEHDEDEEDDSLLIPTFIPAGRFIAENQGDVTWLVKDWLPTGSICIINAPPESYKTWVTADLAVSVATGAPFFGFETVKRGRVLWIQQEDPATAISQKLQVIHASKFPPKYKVNESNKIRIRFKSVEALNDILIQDPEALFTFGDDDAVEALDQIITDIDPEIVIIDPLYIAANIEDHFAKAVQDMLIMKHWRREGPSFVLVHHTAKGRRASLDRESALGSQFLNAFPSVTWTVRQPDMEKSSHIVVQRTFKVAERPSLVGLDFKIDTKSRAGYKVKVKRNIKWEPVVSDENGGPKKRKRIDDIQIVNPNAKSLRINILNILGTEKAMSTQKIADKLRRGTKTIERMMAGLSEEGVVKSKGFGRWVKSES